MTEAARDDSPQAPPAKTVIPPAAILASTQVVEVPSGRVRAVVAKHIEPVTRFDAADLHETEPEQAYGVAVEVVLAQTFVFEVSSVSGPAHLPTGTDKVSGAGRLSGELVERLARARREAPDAIKRWADASAGSYRRLMPAGAAFLNAPGRVGYEHTCTTCDGECRITCSSCSGRGHNNCHSCYGSGKINCYSCYGSKKVNCGSCGGRGSWIEQISQQTWSSTSNSYVTTYRSERKSCSACNGSGRSTCHVCGYDGKISCSGCFGRGTINCMPCGATGKVECPACLASGIQHVWGTVNCEVARDEALTDAAEEPALSRLIQEQLPREDLPELGELLDVQHNTLDCLLETRHRLRLDVLRAQIHARERDFVIHGFGPMPKVYSFENMAGHLLADDLAALEASVAGAARWRRHRSSELLDTAADFLRSELNMLIAEKVADLKSTPQQAAAAVERHFRGLVGAEYVERTTVALHGALGRLYGSELTEPAAYLCGIAAVMAGVMFALGLPQPGPWSAALWSLGGAACAWGVLEWLTRRRIARRFQPAFARRVLGQLSANGSTWRWRIGMSLSAAVAVGFAIWITDQVPLVRSYQTEQRDLAQAEQVLNQWASGGQPDLRLRPYPARRMLDKKAQAGEPQAQLILAWQLLLGAAGASKDVEAAGQWLDKAQPHIGQEPHWQAAKAVWVLNQDAMPDAIRSAAQDLGRAADRGLVEARYWESRIYLEERSPAFDLKRGLQTLTRAADQNHAHAALMLGERLAAGQGTRRDMVNARRYLQQAAGAGLFEARNALAKLR
jgi:TPR repeat protein